MDRRRRVALVLGLVLCLASLGWWAARFDNDTPAPPSPSAANTTRGPIAEVTPGVRDTPKARDTVTVPAPIGPGLSVRGRIVDEITNEGIASATIGFREAAVPRYESIIQGRPLAQSDKDGWFVLDGVTPGAIRLEAWAENYAVREIEIFVSGKLAPVEIALSKGAFVSGYLAGTDGVTPVPGTVSLLNLDEFKGTQIATGPAGEFSFNRLSAGRHLLEARGGGLHGKREFTLSHNERVEGIVLAMIAGHSIRGVISGLRADERASTTVVVNAMGISAGMTQQADVDARGNYEVKGVAPGHVMIEVIPERRGRLSKAVQMPANGDLTVNLAFQTGARLSGRVTRGGKPQAGMTVSVTSSTSDGGLFAQSTIAASNGEYAIENVPDGEYQFFVESYEPPAARVAGDTMVDIDIPEAHLSGRVLEEVGKAPVAGALVDVRLAQPRGDRYRRAGRSDGSGQFAIRGLEPGDFVLTAYKSGYELYRAPLAYGAPIADMRISMRAARGVDITARDAENNRAINNVTVVEIVNGWPGIVLQLQADQNGVSRIPSGLAGSSLKIAGFGYQSVEIAQWNGQPLEVSLQRQPSR